MALASTLAAGLLLPMGAPAAVIRFTGDFVLFAYLLGLARFVTILAGLDTGSSFEGMGAAREATFSAVAEPALFLGLVSLARSTRSLDLSHMLGEQLQPVWWTDGPALLLVGLAVFAVALAENARVPVDDPATHLELTMIHEVMVLDHSGPDLAMIQYGAALKLYLFGARDRAARARRARRRAVARLRRLPRRPAALRRDDRRRRVVHGALPPGPGSRSS